MLRHRSFTLVAAVLLIASGTASAADSNQTPLADAGLDQSIERGNKVFLDASGSRDPDGNIDRYEWTIEGPSGTTKHPPPCSDCERTQYHVGETGRYTVTLTVTDNDGATSTDTLYVDVYDGNPPSVTLTGPTHGTEGDIFKYRTVASSGDAELSRVVWRIDDDIFKQSGISGDTANRTIAFSPGESGDTEVAVTVWDRDGQNTTKVMTPSVESNYDSGGGVCGLARGYGVDTQQDCSEIFDGADRSVKKPDGTIVWLDVNGEPGIQKKTAKGRGGIIDGPGGGGSGGSGENKGDTGDDGSKNKFIAGRGPKSEWNDPGYGF
jgi:hypothetical protein